MAVTEALPDTSPAGPVVVNVGDQPPPLDEGPISRTQIVRYTGAGGDFNPIHHDEHFAVESGQPAVFAHGLLTAGVLSRLVSRWLGLSNVRKFQVRFTGQVWPGDVLTCTGRVDEVHEHKGERTAQCSFRVERQTGDVTVVAQAVARVA